MSAWRRNAETKRYGFGVGDNMQSLVDLRFADGTLLFARTVAEAMALLDDLRTQRSRPRSSLHANGEPVLGRRRKYFNCYFPMVNCTNSSIDCSHKAWLCIEPFCQLSHRFHLANLSIFVTHVFVLLPTLFARGCHSNALFAQRLGGRFAI